MTSTTVLSNARLVLEDEVTTGSVLVRDGRIADVSTGRLTPGSVSGTVDLEGDYLLPGLVEVHTDHLEYHFQPRPKTFWDPIPSVLSHDVQMAAGGATTVFDAVRVGGMWGEDSTEMIAGTVRLLQAIEHATTTGITRAEHLIHLRCEVSAPDVVDAFDAVSEQPLIRLASLMDHTPGQRQYADVEAFRRYVVGRGRVTDDGVEPMMRELQAIADEFSDRNRALVAERARARGYALAAHDDATESHVAESAALGVAISEFPTTEVAAREARARGQFIVMGAPNIVRGGSQSGNVAAQSLLEQGLLDILSSDYVPTSPMQAIFHLMGLGVITLARGAKIVSSNPAAATGLTDRGRIAQGLRADLVCVSTHEVEDARHHPAGTPIPVVRGVWREGRRVV